MSRDWIWPLKQKLRDKRSQTDIRTNNLGVGEGDMESCLPSNNGKQSQNVHTKKVGHQEQIICQLVFFFFSFFQLSSVEDILYSRLFWEWSVQWYTGLTCHSPWEVYMQENQTNQSLQCILEQEKEGGPMYRSR